MSVPALPNIKVAVVPGHLIHHHRISNHLDVRVWAYIDARVTGALHSPQWPQITSKEIATAIRRTEAEIDASLIRLDRANYLITMEDGITRMPWRLLGSKVGDLRKMDYAVVPNELIESNLSDGALRTWMMLDWAWGDHEWFYAELGEVGDGIGEMYDVVSAYIDELHANGFLDIRDESHPYRLFSDPVPGAKSTPLPYANRFNGCADCDFCTFLDSIGI